MLEKINNKMSSREIAEITGKEHRNVLRDCEKLNNAYITASPPLLKIEQGYYTLKNTGKQQHRQFLLTKMQTLDLMTGYNAQLRIKVNRRWEELEKHHNKSLSPAEQLLHNAQLLVEQERKINDHENRLDELEAKSTTRPEYYTIACYGSLNGYSVNVRVASKLGREAAKLCKERGLMTDECPDPRFGKVKMYPKAVLVEVFNNVMVN